MREPVPSLMDIDEDWSDRGESATAFAAEWFIHRKRGLLASSVGTIASKRSPEKANERQRKRSQFRERAVSTLTSSRQGFLLWPSSQGSFCY
jgi:hypothetical protein